MSATGTQAETAFEEVTRFLSKNEIEFMGAGQDAAQKDAKLAWSFPHPVADIEQSNQATFRGLVEIFNRYPGLSFIVRGESGFAKSAPKALAEYIGKHPVNDLHECMSYLAEQRVDFFENITPGQLAMIAELCDAFAPTHVTCSGEALKLHTTSAPHWKGTCDGPKVWHGRQAHQVAIWRRPRRPRGGGAAQGRHTVTHPVRAAP